VPIQPLEAQEWIRHEIDTTATFKSEALIRSDDSASLHIFYRKSSRLAYARGSGNNWQYYSTGFNRPFAAFEIDRALVVHGVASNSSGDAVLYFRFSPSDSLQDTIAISSGRFTGPDLTLDLNDGPEVSFNRSDLDSLYFGVLSQSTWDIESVARVPPGALATQLEDRDQTVYVAGSSSGPPGAIGYAKRQNDVWQYESVAYDSIYGTFGFDIDDSGRGYIACGRDYLGYQYPLQLYSETDSGWNRTILDTTGTVMGSALGVLANTENSIDIIYAMFSFESQIAFLQYAYKMDGTWHFETIDSISIGYDGAVDMTPDGLIHVCYIKGDGPSGKLIYAYRQHPVSAIDDETVPQPITSDAIKNIAPNPTNGFIRISFDLRSADKVDIDLLDSLGRLVIPILINASYEKGQGYTLLVDLSEIPHLSSGAYFVKLKGTHHLSIKKIVLLK